MYYNVFKIFVSDIIVSQKESNGEGKGHFFGRDTKLSRRNMLHCAKKAQKKTRTNQWKLLKLILHRTFLLLCKIGTSRAECAHTQWFDTLDTLSLCAFSFMSHYLAPNFASRSTRSLQWKYSNHSSSGHSFPEHSCISRCNLNGNFWKQATWQTIKLFHIFKGPAWCLNVHFDAV